MASPYLMAYNALLKINPNYKTSTYKYNYVTYKRKSTVKKVGLF